MAMERIVSLVPSHTEAVFALGQGDQVVGRTKFCIAPEGLVESIPSVGGTKDADLDKILALEPTLVLLDKDENPKALAEGLDAAGIPYFVTAVHTVDAAKGFLWDLACRIGGHEQVEAMVADIETAESEVEAVLSIRCACPIWYNPWMIFNGTAYASDLLRVAGFANVFADREGERYQALENDELDTCGAEVLLLPSEPFPFHKQWDRVKPGGLTDLAEHAHQVDGEALTWFGTRTAEGIRTFGALAQSLRTA